MNSQDIARRAYTIWEMDGHPHGKALDHWLQAESELAEVKRAPSGGISAKPASKVMKGKKLSRPALRATR